MGRTSKALLKFYEGNVHEPSLTEDGKLIIPIKTDITCGECNKTYLTEKMIAKKVYRCENCGSSKSLMFDDKLKDTLTIFNKEPDLEPTPEPKEKPKGKPKGKKGKSKEFELGKFEFDYFSGKEKIHKNSTLVKQAVDEGNTKLWVENISKEKLFDLHFQSETESTFGEDDKLIIYEELNERKLFDESKKYIEKRNNAMVGEKKSKKTKAKGKEKPDKEEKEVKEKPEKEIVPEDYDEYEKEQMERYKIAEIKRKVKAEIETDEKKKKFFKGKEGEDFLERIAQAIASKNIFALNFFAKWSKSKEVSEEEKQQLEFEWELVVDMYEDKIEELLKWLCLAMLIITNIMVCARMYFEGKAKTEKEKEKKKEIPTADIEGMQKAIEKMQKALEQKNREIEKLKSKSKTIQNKKRKA